MEIEKLDFSETNAKVLGKAGRTTETVVLPKTFLSREHNSPHLRSTSMLTLHQHRAIVLAVSLALLFSSVGLPVIVVACEMGTMVKGRGCSVLSRRGTPSGVNITGIPCQAQYHFIEGNTTAYVPAKRAVDQQPLQLLAILPHVSFVAALTSPFSRCPSESPPRTRDISLLTSTLLI